MAQTRRKIKLIRRKNKHKRKELCEQLLKNLLHENKIVILPNPYEMWYTELPGSYKLEIVHDGKNEWIVSNKDFISIKRKEKLYGVKWNK